MKVRRILILFSWACLVTLVGLFALQKHRELPQPSFNAAPQLLSALQAYQQELVRRQQPVPSTVSIRTLLDGGYLATNDVRAFEGMEVELSLPNGDKQPDTLLACIRLPDGTRIALLGDGSIQALSPGRYAEYRRHQAPRGDTRTGSPPASPTTTAKSAQDEAPR